jgi:hypothetical protein
MESGNNNYMSPAEIPDVGNRPRSELEKSQMSRTAPDKKMVWFLTARLDWFKVRQGASTWIDWFKVRQPGWTGSRCVNLVGLVQGASSWSQKKII